MVGAAAALAVVLSAGCGGRQKLGDRRSAAEIEPAALVATPTRGGSVATARVRFYVDAGYRQHNPDVRAELGRVLAAASQVLGPTIGVTLELAEVRDWRPIQGSTLQGDLTQLEDLDPAADVDWVVGLTAPLGHVSSDLDKLGAAQRLGRHLVLRSLNDEAELALLSDVLGSLPARRRQELWGRRRRHQQAVLFLHQLGHSLGAMHVTDSTRLMSTSYDSKQAGFAADNAGLMRAAATARLAPGGRGAPEREWKAVLAYVHQHAWEGWNEDEKSALTADLEGRLKELAEAGAGMALSDKVRPADRETFRTAERLAKAGSPLDAWTELEPLIGFYPDERGVQLLACRLAVAAKRDSSAVAARCGQAARLAPAQAEPHLRLAQARAGDKDTAAALAEARRADQLLAAGGGGTALDAELAALYQQLGAVTWAEGAARRAGKAGTAVLTWARGVRARYGLTAGGPVPPAKDADYVAAVRQVLTAVYSQKFGEAEKLAAAMRQAYGKAAGIDAALCDLEIRRHNYPAARAHCQEALARDAGEAWAHYLLGLLDKHGRKPADAIKHLERAVALDPTLQNAYQVAVELCTAQGRTADASRLRSAYQKQFGSALP